MPNNITIKDGLNVSKSLHTIEDSTSVHFNQSIPTDIANNTATVVSGGQAVAAGMGALVVAQRDALPAGTNLIGSVSISPGGLNIPVSVANTINVATHAVTQSGVWSVSVNDRVSVATVGTPVDGFGNVQNLFVAGMSMVRNRNSNTWDMMTGTSIGVAVVQAGIWNVGLNAGTNLVGAVSISPNGLNIPVSLAPLTFNVPVSIAGTPTVGLAAGTNLVGAVSISPNGLNIPVSLAPPTFNVPVSIANIANVSVTGTLKAQLWDLGNNVAASFAADNADGLATSGTANRLRVVSLNAAYNRNSGTWDLISGTSTGLFVQGNASAGSTNLGRSLIVGGTDGTNNRTLLTTTGGALVVHISNALPAAGASMLQTVGAAVTTEGYPMLGSDGSIARRLLTTTGGALVVHVSNAQPTPSGISMLQTVGAAVTTEGYPMLGSDGTLARRLLTTTGGALVVHVSNTAPGGAGGGGSMTHTVGAAVTTEGYPMLGSDGTLSRRLLTTTGGALIVHVSNAAPGGGAGGSTMTQTVGAAVTNQGYPMLGTDGTNARGLLTTTGGALVVHISNALPAAGASMLQTVGAAVTNQGYPMLGTDGTNARGLLTTTGGALIVHVSNSAPGAGGGGGSTQLVSVGGAVSTQGVQIVGKDPNSNARTLKTNVSGALYITTRTFMSQDVFTRPADTTAYAAGATAAPGNAGDLIANSVTNTAVKPLKFRIAKGPGQVSYIRGARMYRTGGGLAAGQHNIAGSIRLHLFNTANKVSVANGDNGFLNASPVSNWMGYIDLVAIACAPGLRTSGAVSTQVYWGSPARTGEMIVDLSAAQVSIQGLLETRIAFTPISGEIFTVQIEGFNG